MGKHAKTNNADEGDRKAKIIKWLKVTGLVVLVLVLLGTVGALALLASVTSRIQQDVDPETRKQITQVKPLEPQNILLLGSDSRGEKHARSDTIIIAHIDTKHRKITLVSIPRDLRVEIPGYGKDKINAAMFLGGPSLTIKTIRKLTGLPIHHYAEIDFEGFKQLVNAVGGVWINVEKRIDDPKAGPTIEPGYQRLFGKTALAYVRTRKDVTGDYARIKRQQKFFAALIAQSKRFQTLFAVPQLINIFADNTETDMNLSELTQLAMHMRSIKKQDLTGVTLPCEDKMINGVWYALPHEEQIAAICGRVKRNLPVKDADKPGAKVVGVSPTSIKPRDVSVEVRNGGGPSGAAAGLGRKLNSLGYIVMKVGNANDDYSETKIVYTKERAKAQKVEGIVGKGELVAADGEYQTSADVLVILGQDY
ncbi:MAG: LytR family transcriptional regulator [Actinobacteria bacterium]|jgi:LCP family protein required for cell wall assembly|nr:MAG: LytR family transcriptional regulator [Actinomycetota bacterium]